MWLSLFGSINSVFIFVSLLGILSQLRKVWRVRQQNIAGRATTILSLNQFSVSYLAYFSFFIYGAVIDPFNHFIVWPRLIAAMIVTGILVEIWRDRKSRIAGFAVFMALISMAIGMVFLLYGESYQDNGKSIATLLIVVITLFLAQGYAHQIAKIIRARSTGAVDIRMSQFIFLMDISTITLALAMGISDGWPLLFLASVSATTKLIIMYLFRWVRQLNEKQQTISNETA